MLLQSPYRTVPDASVVVPSVRHFARITSGRIPDLASRLLRCLKERLSAPRRTSHFMAIDGRTLTDIGLHPSQRLAATVLGSAAVSTFRDGIE